MNEGEYESTAFIRSGGNIPSRDALPCPEFKESLNYCYRATDTRCVNTETPSEEESILIGSNNYQHEVRTEDVFRRRHCKRHRLQSGTIHTRKCVVKCQQLADYRAAVDESTEFTGEKILSSF